MALQERVWGSGGNTTAITNYGVTLETVRGDVRGYPVSQRDTAYQPRATPWGPSPAPPGVLMERRISVNGGRAPYQSRCGVPPERLRGPRVYPGFHPGLVCAAPLGRCRNNPATQIDRGPSSFWFVGALREVPLHGQGGSRWVRGPPAHSSDVRWQAYSRVVAQALVVSAAPPRAASRRIH